MRYLFVVLLISVSACSSRPHHVQVAEALAPSARGGLSAGAFAGLPQATSAEIRDADDARIQRVGARIMEASAAYCRRPPVTPGEDQRPDGELGRPKGPLPLFEALSVPVCDFPLTLMESGEINAFSDGRRIKVTRGLVGFAVSDAQLAFAIAHEVSHNLLHAGRGALNGSRKQLEYDADHFGLYLVARAGIDTEDAIGLVRRLAARPDQTRLHPDYPTFGARLRKLPPIAREIEQRRASGSALSPELFRRTLELTALNH